MRSIKNIFQNIKFSPKTIWQIVVISFLTFLVIIFILNIEMSLKIKKEINSLPKIETKIKLTEIKTKPLENIINELNEKEKSFKKILNKPLEIKDPSI